DARRFENWERYFAGQAALGRAVDYAMAWGLEAIWGRVQALSGALRAGLSTLPGIEVTDEGVEKCGIVTFQHAGQGATEIKQALGEAGFNVSVSSGSGMKLSYLARGLDAVVRASVHYYNTDEEVERFVAQVRAITRG
ncbi:MAG: aminotransferase class V-fold PLP-dependent enzyme, partial [Proteobacteria bacterium]|nr:aminotransferase class V-fold PLP-dependent enzyme [Pseudomonadota bacterium]